MFSSVYQKGSTGVEIFTPTGKEPFKNVLCRTEINSAKFYDRNIKGYAILLDSESHNPAFQIPRKDSDSLGVSQSIVCVQLQCVSEKKTASVEFILRDDQRQRRRLHFSNRFRELSINPLHAQVPWHISSSDDSDFPWCSWVLDLSSLCIQCFQTQFSSLEGVRIYGTMHLRKLFSLPRNAIIGEGEGEGMGMWDVRNLLIPVSLDFSAGTPAVRCMWTLPRGHEDKGSRLEVGGRGLQGVPPPQQLTTVSHARTATAKKGGAGGKPAVSTGKVDVKGKLASLNAKMLRAEQVEAEPAPPVTNRPSSPILKKESNRQVTQFDSAAKIIHAHDQEVSSHSGKDVHGFSSMDRDRDANARNSRNVAPHDYADMHAEDVHDTAAGGERTSVRSSGDQLSVTPAHDPYSTTTATQRTSRTGGVHIGGRSVDDDDEDDVHTHRQLTSSRTSHHNSDTRDYHAEEQMHGYGKVQNTQIRTSDRDHFSGSHDSGGHEAVHDAAVDHGYGRGYGYATGDGDGSEGSRSNQEGEEEHFSRDNIYDLDEAAPHARDEDVDDDHEEYATDERNKVDNDAGNDDLLPSVRSSRKSLEEWIRDSRESLGRAQQILLNPSSHVTTSFTQVNDDKKAEGVHRDISAPSSPYVSRVLPAPRSLPPASPFTPSRSSSSLVPPAFRSFQEQAMSASPTSSTATATPTSPTISSSPTRTATISSSPTRTATISSSPTRTATISSSPTRTATISSSPTRTAALSRGEGLVGDVAQETTLTSSRPSTAGAARSSTRDSYRPLVEADATSRARVSVASTNGGKERRYGGKEEEVADEDFAPHGDTAMHSSRQSFRRAFHDDASNDAGGTDDYDDFDGHVNSVFHFPYRHRGLASTLADGDNADVLQGTASQHWQGNNSREYSEQYGKFDAPLHHSPPASPYRAQTAGDMRDDDDGDDTHYGEPGHQDDDVWAERRRGGYETYRKALGEVLQTVLSSSVSVSAAKDYHATQRASELLHTLDLLEQEFIHNYGLQTFQERLGCFFVDA
eukprot:gene27486-33191_t